MINLATINRMLSLAVAPLVFSNLYAADIVMNGDFEEPAIPYAGADLNWGSVDSYAAGHTIPGWVIGGGSIDIVSRSYWLPASGNQSVDLNGLSPAYIYQDFNTVAGSEYILRFAMSGNVHTPSPFIVRMDFVWEGAIIDDLTFDVQHHSAQEMGWNYYEYTFTALGDVSRLTFRSLTTTALVTGPALDDVSLNGLGSAVWPPTPPLPDYSPLTWYTDSPGGVPDAGSSLLLLSSAIALIGAARRWAA